MDIPPRRGCDRSQRVHVDEEATFAPQVRHLQEEPQVLSGFKLQVSSGFQVPPMPQLSFFPFMTPEACQAYANFWYAQAQVGQGKFPIPPTTTFL